jgi:hypothetical protein
MGMYGMGSGLMSGLFGLLSSSMAQRFSAGQVTQQEDYQTQMSDTSYQRAMSDMKLAGLNPILAYGKGGASTPSGGAATGVAPQLGNPIGEGISTAMKGAQLNNELQAQALRNSNTIEDTINKRRIGDAQVKNMAADNVLKVLEARQQAPDAIRGDLDKAVLQNSAVAAAREASTGAAETARGVGAVKDSINPLKGMFSPSGTAKSISRTPVSGASSNVYTTP